MSKRIEIDHLQTRPAVDALRDGSTGLGYNMGGVSYYWTMVRVDGGIVVNVEGRFEVAATDEQIASLAHLPVCGFVSHLVQGITGNDALALLDLIGR